jgi:peptidoglycan/xylan/chitin deacetylase (PgdA/CDA1 family)
VALTARRVAKSVAAAFLDYTGLRGALVALRRSQLGGCRILILSYHRVVADFTGEVQRSIPGLLISVETFRRHLLEARAAGYQLVTLSDALEVLGGRRPSRRDLCVVTFDDGYRDMYRHAFPVLQSMGAPAMVYLPAGYIGTNKRFTHDRLFHLAMLLRARGQRPLYDTLPPSAPELLEPVSQGLKSPSGALDDFIADHSSEELEALIAGLEKQLGGGPELIPEQGDVMSWDEVRKMAAAGIEVGAHTINHAVLTLADPAAAEREIVGSKLAIEKEVRQPVRDFAYPNGWYSDAVIAALIKAGFRSAVTTEDLVNRIGGDPFALKRKVLWENFSIGMTGEYSASLTRCHMDDVFGVLRVNRPVSGRRSGPNRIAMDAANRDAFHLEARG